MRREFDTLRIDNLCNLSSATATDITIFEQLLEAQPIGFLLARNDAHHSIDHARVLESEQDR